MPSTLAVTPVIDTYISIQPAMDPVKEENLIRQAWYSLEEAFHLREPVPPPVPPKDERWLIKTVNLAFPQEEQDPSFWDKIVQRITSLHTQFSDDSGYEGEVVSINMPAEAALQQLGIQADDSELQDKKNYFKRMAVRCKEKFDADGKQSTDGSLSFYSEEEGSDTQSTKSSSHRYHHRHPHLHMRHYLQALHCHFHPQTLDETPLQDSEQAQFVPKVDPKETKAAHRAIYHHGQANVNNSDDDDEEDRKLFGSWWGCHSKRSRTEKLLDKQLDNEWEKIDLPKSAEEKRKSLGERNGGLPGNTFSDVDPKRPWWKQGTQNAEIVVARGQSAHTQDRKVAAKRHQAIAAAAAYEAVKEYHARRARQGKKVSHGEMKAILAGMAMAEAVKLLESHCGDDSGEGNGEKDETVAEAGSVALKLFELMR